MKTDCWRDWVPGVLSDEQVKELIPPELLMYLDGGDIDPSALNLRLEAGKAWKMKKGAVKPFGDTYDHVLKNTAHADEIDFDSTLDLESRTTYVFKLQLEFSREFMEAKRFYGHATGRSSVGRVDVRKRIC